MPAPQLYPLSQLPRAEKVAPWLCEQRWLTAAEWQRVWILRDADV